MRSQHFHLLKGSEIEFDGHHRTREYKFNKKVMFYFLKNYNLGGNLDDLSQVTDKLYNIMWHQVQDIVIYLLREATVFFWI
jgi:hypothetical protein